jgi:hypothetical protein
MSMRRFSPLALASLGVCVAFGGMWLGLDEPAGRDVERVLAEAASEIERVGVDRARATALLARLTQKQVRLFVAEAPELAAGRAGCLELLARAGQAESFMLDVAVSSVELSADAKRAHALGDVTWRISRQGSTATATRKIDVWLDRDDERFRVASLSVARPTREEPEARP